MTDQDDAAVNEVRARLQKSREEVSVLIDPPREVAGPAQVNGKVHFPRSRTVQMLVSSRGLGALGVLAGGFLIARPALALKLLRLLPMGAVAKIIIARTVSALNSRGQSK